MGLAASTLVVSLRRQVQQPHQQGQQAAHLHQVQQQAVAVAVSAAVLASSLHLQPAAARQLQEPQHQQLQGPLERQQAVAQACSSQLVGASRAVVALVLLLLQVLLLLALHQQQHQGPVRAMLLQLLQAQPRSCLGGRQALQLLAAVPQLGHLHHLPSAALEPQQHQLLLVGEQLVQQAPVVCLVLAVPLASQQQRAAAVLQLVPPQQHLLHSTLEGLQAQMQQRHRPQLHQPLGRQAAVQHLVGSPLGRAALPAAPQQQQQVAAVHCRPTPSAAAALSQH